MTEDDLDERIERMAAVLQALVDEAGWWRSGDDKISEESAARLLGWHPASLRNLRGAGGGPDFFRLGGGGCRISYRILSIAEFIELSLNAE